MDFRDESGSNQKHHGGFLRHLIHAMAHFLLDSPGVRLLGKVLPRGLRRRVASTLDAALDQRARELSKCVREHLLTSDLREMAAWREVRTRKEWEVFREVRIDALHRSLGNFPPEPHPLALRTTRTLSCDGFCIENLVFESRPGLVITANLYRSSKPTEPMPGILVCHSHHYPKTEDELQAMGATWARCGCTVLVIDQLCHGERRQHPFRSAGDYQGPFQVGRQDRFFRYNVGMQLHLIGDSLIGWMVWDLMRGVDLLLDRPGVDPDRIVLIGAVAGGGVGAAIAAALDRRIAAVVPFGFGKAGTAGRSGSGSWESTRNLRLSARDGFAPWVILGAVADRRLVYAHEFAWDPESDPVWKRLTKIYELCGVPDHLAAIHGSGSASGRSPQDTHCNNVGPIHRQQIYRLFERWFGIPPPIEEYRLRRPAEELLCVTPELPAESRIRPVHRLAAELGEDCVQAARRRLRGLGARSRRTAIQRGVVRLLGDIDPVVDPRIVSRSPKRVEGASLERVVLEAESGIAVPTILLIPELDDSTRPPVVIGVTQEGGQRLLGGRADLIADLLRDGVAVCLPELRGTGDPGDGDEFRGRRSAATVASSSELMLGWTLLGARLRDLRSVMRYLRACRELDSSRVAIWGDSFAPPNPAGQNLAVPFDAEPFPTLCEPLGGLLALLGSLFEEDVRALYVCGGLAGYASLLESPFCYVPHDVIVPGILMVGDLCDVAAALAPLPLRMEALVDGLNRQVTAEQLVNTFHPTRVAYRAAGAAEQLRLETARQPAKEVAQWITTRLHGHAEW